jgi:hypothetical protein
MLSASSSFTMSAISSVSVFFLGTSGFGTGVGARGFSGALFRRHLRVISSSAESESESESEW